MSIKIKGQKVLQSLILSRDRNPLVLQKFFIIGFKSKYE